MGCRVKERAIQEKMIKGDGRKVIEDYRVRKKKDERGKEEQNEEKYYGKRRKEREYGLRSAGEKEMEIKRGGRD